MQKLPTNFIHEVIRLCIQSKKVCEICVEHFHYQYIPDELPELKKIFKTISTFYKTNDKIPSFGVISKLCEGDLKTLEQVELVKSLDITKIDEKSLLDELEDYVKKSKFSILNQQIYDLYNSGKQDEAIQLSAEKSPDIANFTLKKDTSQFVDIVANFDKFLNERRDQINTKIDPLEEESQIQKFKFGIDEIDEMSRGGMKRKDTALFIAPSGYGKSTFMKWVGFYNCVFNNANILHLQLEGGKDEVIEKYYQMFFNLTSEVLEKLSYSEKKSTQIEKLFLALQKKLKDITVYSSEMFDDMSIRDAYNLIREYQKVKGYYPDMVLADSLDLFEVGDGKKYPASYEGIKLRKNAVAKKMKNIATEFDLAFLTVDQVSGLPPEKLNDPDFVITRYHTEGDRTLIKPFSFVLSHNQTKDEYANEKARIYIDKFRNFKVRKQVVNIYTKYDYGRYYDANRTKKKIIDV